MFIPKMAIAFAVSIFHGAIPNVIILPFPTAPKLMVFPSFSFSDDLWLLGLFLLYSALSLEFIVSSIAKASKVLEIKTTF